MGIVTFESTADANDAVKADTLCKEIGSTLRWHYPQRDWYVDVSLRGGAVKIMCPSITTRYGYVLHIKGGTVASSEIVRAGGEILERFKLSRAPGAEGDEENLLRDSRGEAVNAAEGL